MWFNRGSGGSPVRLNRLPHGFTPASLRCLCTMDPESLGKALQDCLRALGTGQGADAPAVHGVGDHPMLVHTHPKDDSPLTGEIALGYFPGGELFTSALICANGPSRPAWIRWGRDLLWGHIVDPRYRVMFNALRPHVPLAWSGQRIVLVPYTGIAWGRLPVAMQNELVTFGFPR